MKNEKSYSPIELYAINKFQLFKGIRSDEEDKKIFEKILDNITVKILDFLAENITTIGMDSLKKEFELSAKKLTSTEERYEKLGFLTVKYLAYVSNYKFKLNNYLEGYIDNLAFESNEVPRGKPRSISNIFLRLLYSKSDICPSYIFS